MAYGPDWSSDSEDSLFADDGDYHLKGSFKSYNTPIVPRELTEEEKRKQLIDDFYGAVNYGNINKVKEIIATGFNVNLELKDRYTALMLAASHGNPDIAKILIEAGGNVNLDRDSETPLMMACKCLSSFEKSFDTIKLLVEKGANVQAINRKRMDALMCAACSGNLLAVEYLLPRCNTKAEDNQRWTALTWAVSNNQPQIVHFLYENGFRLDLVDVRGNTALDIARDIGADDIINLFPKKDDDIVMEILGRSTINFEESFLGLKNGERPSFFEEICNLLLSVKCSHLIPLFLEKNVSLDQFLAMNDADLKKIGVLLPYQRNRILTGLHRFHKQPFHPKSIYVSVKNEAFSNVDVATKLMSAIKQLIAMEASLKILVKNFNQNQEKLTKEERERMITNINNIKAKSKSIKAVTRKLDMRFQKWDALVKPADLITKESIRSHFPWKKISFCLSIFSIVLVCKFRSSILQ